MATRLKLADEEQSKESKFYKIKQRKKQHRLVCEPTTSNPSEEFSKRRSALNQSAALDRPQPISHNSLITACSRRQPLRFRNFKPKPLQQISPGDFIGNKMGYQAKEFDNENLFRHSFHSGFLGHKAKKNMYRFDRCFPQLSNSCNIKSRAVRTSPKYSEFKNLQQSVSAKQLIPEQRQSNKKPYPDYKRFFNPNIKFLLKRQLTRSQRLVNEDLRPWNSEDNTHFL